MDGIDVVFSSVGISRQRDGLTFEQVDYELNHRLIELAEAAHVEQFVYISLEGADSELLRDLAITRAHERVVADLEASELDHRVIRPCGYFSDMGAILDMAKRGRVLLVGDGSNRMSPIHGRDVAEAAVTSLDGDAVEVVAGGPQTMTQRQAAEMAFEVVGKPPKIHVVPLWLAGGLAKGIGMLSRQFGDLAEFIVVAGEVDGVGPPVGETTLRSYFESLLAEERHQAENLPPNHHADHRQFGGPLGYLAGLTMVAGRGADARLVADLAAVGPDDRVVDIGCGPGTAAREATARGATVSGVDPSAPMLRLARLVTALRRTDGPLDWIEAGAEDIPLADDSVSVCWSLKAVHHWPDLDAGLAEVKRILRPGGRFVVLENCADVGATGTASHGWTPQQAGRFAELLVADGYGDVVTAEHESGRRRVVTVGGRAPGADG